VGWNNPLPIGQAQGVALGESEPCLGQGWKKVYPVAGPVRGQSSSPWVRGPSPIHISPPNSPFSRDHRAFYTSHPPFSYNSRSSFSHPPPLPDPLAPEIATQGYSGGNDPLGKGSCNLPNASGSGTINSKTKRRIWACVSLGGFIFLHFLSFFPFSLTSISAIYLFLRWKIGD